MENYNNMLIDFETRMHSEKKEAKLSQKSRQIDTPSERPQSDREPSEELSFQFSQEMAFDDQDPLASKFDL